MASQDVNFDPLEQAERCLSAGDVPGGKACLRMAEQAGVKKGQEDRFETMKNRLEEFTDRRRILSAMAGFAGFSLFAGIGAGILAFLLPPKKKLAGAKTLEVGKASEFPNSSSRLVEAEARTILVVRDAAGEFHALSAVCTHSDVCLVEWNPEIQELSCPCHRAVFDLQGNVLEGPPPKPLARFNVGVQNEMVVIQLG